MERTKKVIIVLLVLAIIFSVISIAINLLGSNSDIFSYYKQIKNKDLGNSGGVQLNVEANPESAGGIK